MALAPIGQLIGIKPRPQTTLQLLLAIEDPVSTVSDYVFTPSIKEHFGILLQNLRSGYGGGYWALSEYGGGKTHFLAVLTSLLSATDKVLEHVKDREIQQVVQQVRNQRLFPVAFNLIGRGDMLNQRNALFRILEDEIQTAAHRLLGGEVALNLPAEVRTWWDGLGAGTRSDIAEKYQESFEASPDVDYIDSPERWAVRIAEGAGALGIRIDVSSTPVDRLVGLYQQIVNERTGYSGLLIVMDEFASWQDQRPEGGTAYTEDENLLQTLAETLPRDHSLNIFTVVASQKPMPRKFEGERFRQFDLLRTARPDASPSIEYAMVVASRVRDIIEYRAPEIEEYHDYYRNRFHFARYLSLDDFNAIFPMQPLSFDVLRRITSNLTSTRTGINVLWDVLGQGDPEQPELRFGLSDTRRLITASDLLESDTLEQDLQQSVRYGAAHNAYQQAIEQVERLAARDRVFEDDVPTAMAIVRTLFLWHCSRDGQTNITLDEMTEAVLPEEGILDSPQDALLSILGAIEDVPQIDFDPETGELSFRADIMAGRSGVDVFDEYRARFRDPGTVQINWQQNLSDPSLSARGLSTVLAGLETGTLTTRTVVYRGINYSGEVVAITNWTNELRGQLPFDTHFRLVFMLEDDVAIASESLEDDRTLVCVPGALSTENRDAMTDVMALNAMEEDYSPRQDDEALRVNQFVDSRRSEITTSLLMAQRDFYKRGQIVSRLGITINANDIFGTGSELLGRLVTQVFDELFVGRPIGNFSRNRTMNLNTETGRVFAGLWEREPERSVRNALENFAVGLGLAQGDKPLRYDPTGCDALDMIRVLYTDAQAGGNPLQVSQVHEQLARVGIPARLATLYLLCYVRSNTDVQLLLKGNHRIRLTDGEQLQGNLIRSNLVPKIEWNSRAFATASYFDTLAKRKGPIWNDSIDWTRKIAPNLEAATDPERIERETQQLLYSLENLHERLQNASEQVHTLELQLNGTVPSDVKESVELIRALTLSRSFEEFMATLESSNLMSADELGHAVTDTHNLYLLGQAAVEIIPAYAYLNNLPANRFDGDLTRLGQDRDALIRDIDLTILASHPGQWPRIKGRFEAWKRVYAREYRKLHRDFHLETSQVRQHLSEINEKLTALENIERVEQITHTHSAPQLRTQLEAVQEGFIQCDPSVEASVLEAVPHCTRCGVRIGDTPTRDVSSLESQISHALDEVIGILKTDTIDNALAKSESPVLMELRESLKEDNSLETINILKDNGLVELLQGVLKGESDSLVIIRDISIVTELAKEYPTVSSESIHEVANRFRELVEEALKTQQQHVGPNVKVEMRLL